MAKNKKEKVGAHDRSVMVSLRETEPGMMYVALESPVTDHNPEDIFLILTLGIDFLVRGRLDWDEEKTIEKFKEYRKSFEENLVPEKRISVPTGRADA